MSQRVKLLVAAAVTWSTVASATPGPSSGKISPKGTGGFGWSTVTPTAEAPEGYRAGPETNMSFQKFITGAVSRARVPSSGVPTPPGLPVGYASPAFTGITHLDQRFADNGNQFSLEPPDQGLAIGGTTECNGGPCILEAVNNAIALYDGGGHLLGSASMHQFFDLPSSFHRPSGPFGPFLSDPKIYFDWQTGRWFVTELEIDQDPKTGALQGHSSVLIAVSLTSHPFGGFYVYQLETTNGGAPGHPGCPCFGDQPLIGADAHAFWVSTNEFPIFAAGFNGAQVYAIDKLAMESGLQANVQNVLQGGPLAEGIAYTVQPAIVPPGGGFAEGTQYFLSSLEFFGGLDNRIAVWAASNTASIHTTPAITMQSEVVENTLVYGQPPLAQQPSISVSQICDSDLFMIVGCGLQDGSLLGQAFNVHAPLVKTNDDRMQQVTYADGKLWSALTTVVKTRNGPTRSAGAWFALTPAWNGADLTGSYSGGGYIAVNAHSVMYPSIAVTKDGRGAVGFSIVGASAYPGTGYAKVSLPAGATEVKLTSLGVFPDDGFTGYPVFDDRAGRWGDYSAAVADASGRIWMANENIPCQELAGPGLGCFRSLLANWGTLIATVTP